MLAVIPPIMSLTPYSVTDMLESSVLVSQPSDWEWTIVRAPTLRETPPVGYKLCKISEVTSAHVLSRCPAAHPHIGLTPSPQFGVIQSNPLGR